LKQRISNHQQPHCPELSYERLLNTMNNQDVRQQQLYEQYRKVVKQAKEDMMTLYLSSAEAQMHHYHKKFNTEMKQFWKEEQTLTMNQKSTEIMVKLIQQRYNNVSESVKCVYNYKAQLIRLNSVDS
jgi:hypothetical protein